MQDEENFCTICGCINPEILKNHDPAFHVANAYHKDKDGKCASCGESWPCITKLTYTDHSELFNSTDVFIHSSYYEGFYFRTIV